MDEFINRGSGAMNRSLSTSRVTFSDGRDTQTKNKSRYYSAQLNAHGESKTLEGSIDTKIYNTKLDVLFPLRKPNSSGILTPQRINQMDESPGDRPAYADALDTSLDCSDITDNEQLNSMMQTIMKVKPPNDLPAHEVVMQANDDNGFAYSPIASAFVFSPTKDSHCATRHYLQPSSLGKIGHGILNSRAKCGNEDQNQKVIQQPKSILKNAQYHELQRTQSLSVRTGNGSQTAPFPPCIQQSKSLNHSSSQKISSVLLRFAEAEERHFNPKKQHQHHGIRAPACIQPMCSFLGRALLCRTKLTSHSSWGHP
ncbi:hypothetical protein KP509_18G069600 [Ceratopteris richardii]|nr:hypothetical protein KP509_18G069600 [Ceratopteris richardii]